MKFVDLTGKKFGRLTVLELLPKRKKHREWLVVCDCGKKLSVMGSNISYGTSKSCGCLFKELLTKRNLKHGHARKNKISKTYNSWYGMFGRCYSKKNNMYRSYGARGIRVCKRWNKFENFLKDMGVRPENTSIGRINNDGNYTPKNCRWENTKQQARNKSTTFFVKYKNKTKSLSDWCDELNLSYSMVSYRLKKLKMSSSDAFELPPGLKSRD